MTDPLWLDTDAGRIAYRPSPGEAPTVLFLPGFRSDMEGQKALELEAHCHARGQGFLRFDYTGHGRSSGRFEDGTIGDWTRDALAVVDRLTQGPLVLVGSSMGGWIMLLVARARPERLHGLVGIAAAPDFTEDLIWNVMTEAQRQELARVGVHLEPSPYAEAPTPITWQLVAEGRRHLVLRDRLAISCPVHLIHGQKDPDVPWQTSLDLAERLQSEDVTLELVKDGEHRLSRPQDLARLLAAVDRIVAGVR